MLLGSPFVLKVGGRTSRAQRDIGVPPCPTTGVPAFGHSTPLWVFIDPDLLHYDEARAAAGTSNDNFGIGPNNTVVGVLAPASTSQDLREPRTSEPTHWV